MTNTSGIIPLGRAILVEPWEPQRKASIIALPEWVKDKERALDVKVRVLALGGACYPDEESRCSPGDIVYIAKMSGFVTMGDDGKPYRLVNDRDVFAKLTNGGSNE